MQQIVSCCLLWFRQLLDDRTLQKNRVTDFQATSNGFYPLSATCQIPRLGTIFDIYFGQRNDGCFVEVGAYDGEYCSNTSGLADVGWRGYYIEPVPQYAELCKSRHSRNSDITVSQYAIGDREEKINIHVGGPLSTVSDNMKAHFESLPWAQGQLTGIQIEVEQLTLDQYLVLHNISQGFELLVVDVEGREWSVLREFNCEYWRPQMIIIELHDQNPDYSCIRAECNQVVQYFDEHAYKVVYKDFTNTVYVPKYSYPIHS